MGGIVPVVTALPSSPRHDQEVYYDTGTAGVYWHLIYESVSAKWNFLGGAPLSAVVTHTNNTSSTSFQTTNTPTVTTPLAGDYILSFGSTLIQNQATTVNQMELALFVAGSSDGLVFMISNNQFEGGAVENSYLKTGLSASTALNPRYRSQSGKSSDFRYLFVMATPVRVS